MTTALTTRYAHLAAQHAYEARVRAHGLVALLEPYTRPAVVVIPAQRRRVIVDRESERLMYPTTILEWWHDGAWREIGWRASDPKSTADLREHGRWLAAAGGHYRLVQPSHLADAPPVVVHEYPVIETRKVTA